MSDSFDNEYTTYRDSLFLTRSADNWMRLASYRGPLVPLFGEMWLSGELSVLFADTGVGKSVLAMQIAASIATGVPIAPFDHAIEPQPVLYIDFELSEAQFAARYAEVGPDGALSNPYAFGPNFIRAELPVTYEMPAEFQNDYRHFMQVSLRRALARTGARILIVDNITWLTRSTQGQVDALRLMKFLKQLKYEAGLSILVLAHTPKRHLARTLTVNDLQGSKMIANFADNIFAMGVSAVERNLRYLKHIKPRSTELKYDASNVIVYRLEKKQNFLGFTFTDYGTERSHLAGHLGPNYNEKTALKPLARELALQGKTQREIAAELNISLATVNRYLKK